MPKIAIVGAAHAHVEYVLDELARPDRRAWELLGISDTDPALAERYAERMGSTAFADTQALLDAGPDVVYLAGRYGERGRDALAALRAGAHVIADKPLCTSLDELDEIERAIDGTDLTLTLLLEKRGYPETIAALEVVDSGELGDIVGITSSGPHKLNASARPDWFFDPTQYGGIIGDLAVHDLDAALLFAPADTAVVHGAVAGRDHRGFARYGVATMQTQSTIVTAEVSWMTPQASDVHGEYRMRLVGTRGTAEIHWARSRVDVTTEERPTRALSLPEGRRPAQDALDSFEDGAVPPYSTTADAIAITRLALLAQRAADSGSAMRWTRTTRTAIDEESR